MAELVKATNHSDVPLFPLDLEAINEILLDTTTMLLDEGRNDTDVC